MILPPATEEHVSPVRKHLSADSLYALLRRGFDKIPDHRGRKCPISLTDALMAAFVYGDDYFSGLTTIRFPVEAIR
jgi:hypothetical protein